MQATSTCTWARYYDDSRVLSIDFRGKDGSNSSTYEYADVGPVIWDEFCNSDNRARYFALHIRNKFKATKIWSKE